MAAGRKKHSNKKSKKKAPKEVPCHFSLTRKRAFCLPIKTGARHHFFKRYQIMSENGRIIGYQNLHEIRQTLANRLIRRTKKEVLTQLPKRSDKNLVIPMTQEQKVMHREYADQMLVITRNSRVGQIG